MAKQHTFLQKALAWSVHLFTASGIFFGFLAILAIHNGDFKMAAWWLTVCFFVDAADGTFARMWKVKEVLPRFNGSSIDYVIDFCTYAVIPAFFIYEADLLPDNEIVKLIAIGFVLMASSYYYGKESYVTEDMYFEGFPVLWNIVVFFMFFIFDLSPWANFAMVIILSILHFIPWKYVYPSQNSDNKWLNIGIAAYAIILAFIAIYIYPTKQAWIHYSGYVIITYYLILTLYTTYWKKPKLKEKA